MTMVVRSTIKAFSAARTCSSLRVSRCEVASSSTRIGASFRKARAIAMRWRWPPESWTPRSPDARLQALGQARDELRQRRLLQRALDARSGCIRPREPDIGLQRVVEQIGVLRHQRDALAQSVERELAKVDAGETHTDPSSGSQKRSSRLATVVLPAPEGPTNATVDPAATSNDTSDNAGLAPPRVGEADAVELQRGAAARHRRLERTVDDAHRFRMHDVQPPRRGDRVRELAADLCDLRYRQERCDGDEDQQRQQCRRNPAARDKVRANARGNGQGAQARRELQFFALARKIVEQRKPRLLVTPHERHELRAPPRRCLKRDQTRKAPGSSR